MKKIILLGFGLWLLAAIPLQASVDGRTDAKPSARPWIVMGRGVGNLLGFPCELSSTLVREVREHKKIWPGTYPFRLFGNVFVRVASGVNDIFFMPWVVPFTDDMTSISEGMGLPDYPWQIEA